MSLFTKLRGTIETIFQFGINRAQIRSTSTGELEVRNSADSAYAAMRVGAPAGDNDAVTKLYADSLSKPLIVTAQHDGNNALPANSGSLHYIVVTTTGANADIGDVLYDNGTGVGTVTKLVAANGRTIATTVSLTGGTISLNPDSIYLWDADGSSGTANVWVKIGDASNLTGSVRVIRYAITNAATQDSASLIPASARVLAAQVEVTTPFSGGGTIAIGQAGNTTLLQATNDNHPQSANTFKVEQDTSWGGSALAVRTTVGGAPAAGAGVVTVLYTSPNG